MTTGSVSGQIPRVFMTLLWWDHLAMLAHGNILQLPPDAFKILAGDFNLPDVNWDTDSVKPSSDRVYKGSEDCCNTLLDITRSHNLQQVVSFPTRQQNMLDLLFTSNPTVIQTVKPLPGISDHDSIVQVDFNSTVQSP